MQSQTRLLVAQTIDPPAWRHAYLCAAWRRRLGPVADIMAALARRRTERSLRRADAVLGLLSIRGSLP